MRIKQKPAFTLVEVMLTTVISTFLIAGIYATLLVANRAWSNYSENVVVRQESRRALVWMVEELREARNVEIIRDTTRLVVSFYRPETGIVTYVWDTAGENEGKIIRQIQDKARVLAKNISSFSVVEDKGVVELAVTATGIPAFGEAVSFKMRERVTLRSETNYFRPEGGRRGLRNVYVPRGAS